MLVDRSTILLFMSAMMRRRRRGVEGGRGRKRVVMGSKRNDVTSCWPSWRFVITVVVVLVIPTRCPPSACPSLSLSLITNLDLVILVAIIVIHSLLVFLPLFITISNSSLLKTQRKESPISPHHIPRNHHKQLNEKKTNMKLNVAAVLVASAVAGQGANAKIFGKEPSASEYELLCHGASFRPCSKREPG